MSGVRRLSCILGMSVMACCAMAQEVVDSVLPKDTAGLSEQEILELTTPLYPVGTELTTPLLPAGMESVAPIEGVSSAGDLPVEPVLMPAYMYQPVSIAIPHQRGSTLPRWETGYMYGASGTSGNMMMGYVTTAAFGVNQSFGKYWQTSVGTTLSKYSVFYNTATFDGSVTWQPNRYFGVTAFGTYMPGSFLSSVNVGTYFQWGGYVTLQSDSPWGIELGARQTYDSPTGHDVVPIVKPYFKIGDAKLGIDVGPLIQQSIRGHKNADRNGFSPIPQPIKVLPQVGPRR